MSNLSINVQDYGAVGDGITNDYSAIQEAIDAAAITGACVSFPTGSYCVDATLKLLAGVTLVGEGMGTSPIATPNNGTIIKNIGESCTININGSNAGIRDMIIYDTDNAGSSGGVKIVGNDNLLESIVLQNVLISGFASGTGLLLQAKNNGGVSYCSFYDVRIRHAKIGINIKEDDSSFVNSNSFYHGAISGGGFDYVMLIQGGNNNVFNATIFEPYSSIYGHLVVKQGQVIGNDIRIEGTQQNITTPLVKFASGTRDSVLSGLYSGGLTLDDGDNCILFKSGKSLDFINRNDNLFINAPFSGIVDNAIPYWEVGSEVSVVLKDPLFTTSQYQLKLTIPAGVSSYLRPQAQYLPQIFDDECYDVVNFGAYIRSNVSGVVTTTCKAPAGLATGIMHPGDGHWHMIGMTSWVDRTTSYDPRFLFDNSVGTEALIVFVTMPCLSFGMQTSSIDAAPLSTKGGILMGTLSLGMTSVDTVSSGILVLPHYGNVFEVNGVHTIIRINDETSVRFAKGAVITLLFNDRAVIVESNDYIALIGEFVSVTNASLTLVSNGNGTWREVNRNL